MMRAAWLSLALALPAAAEEARPPLLCGGMEPFWSLEIGAETAVFTAPDPPQIDYVIRHSARAEGRAWPEALTLLAERDTAIALLRPAICSDTISDRQHPWTADILTQRAGQPVVLTGCCRPAPAE